MNRDDFDRLFFTFKRSAFRLEQVHQYLVDEDDEAFTAWLQGRALPPFTVDTSPWLRLIADSTAQGRHWYRVRIVDLPLSDYNRFRLATDSALVAAGDHIYVADRAWQPELDALREDFWMFDDQCVVTLQYDDDGHFEGVTRIPDSDVDRYRAQRDRALHAAAPLDRFAAAQGRAGA